MFLKNGKMSDSHSQTELLYAWSGTICNALTDHQAATDHQFK